MKYFYEANSKENAHVVSDYPWGFTLKCQMSFWIETTKRGQRFVSQSINPKTNRECKPKKSTYSDIMILCEHVDDNGKTKTGYTSIDRYDSKERLEKFLATHGDKLTDDQTLTIKGKLLAHEAYAKIEQYNMVVLQKRVNSYEIIKYNHNGTIVGLTCFGSYLDAVNKFREINNV